MTLSSRFSLNFEEFICTFVKISLILCQMKVNKLEWMWFQIKHIILLQFLQVLCRAGSCKTDNTYFYRNCITAIGTKMHHLIVLCSRPLGPKVWHCFTGLKFFLADFICIIHLPHSYWMSPVKVLI